LRVTTGSAGAVDAHVSSMDVTLSSGAVAPNPPTNTASITGATTTTISPTVSSGHIGNVKGVFVFNTHATVANAILIEHSDGTTAESLWAGTLLVGEFVIMDELGVFTKYSATGLPETLGLPLSTKGDLLGFSTAADRIPVGADGTSLMAAASAALGVKYALATLSNRNVSNNTGFAADQYLVGSSIPMGAGGPIVGTRYKLVFDMVKTAAGAAALAVTVRYGTAGSTADAALLTFTFPVGTALADSGTFEVDVVFRTIGSGTSAVVAGICRLKHNLAQTGLATSTAVGFTQLAVVSSGFNSTPANSLLGVSVNGGTSFSGTNTVAAAECINASI
jgi:hypothetical protein